MFIKAFIHSVFTVKLDNSKLVIIFVGVCNDAPFFGFSLFQESHAFPAELAECSRFSILYLCSTSCVFQVH